MSRSPRSHCLEPSCSRSPETHVIRSDFFLSLQRSNCPAVPTCPSSHIPNLLPARWRPHNANKPWAQAPFSVHGRAEPPRVSMGIREKTEGVGSGAASKGFLWAIPEPFKAMALLQEEGPIKCAFLLEGSWSLAQGPQTLCLVLEGRSCRGACPLSRHTCLC